ncbi:cation-dependent mannose-6-phosphate receptor [Salmo salar]|uniref:Cation-dependent mannose-6-phosphate receptor n=1 Tax=Salmo salar TaxID=8030 RepID=A0A1S3N2L0_SALSA|nr:cation-dependent mannose-6-phosphate receptor [Salmo salar]|eukprot:XP_014009704.1 PREDICTED: cation-dependent mannose-6-phosphate receptor-like isoform X1 [Salmo salar]
MKVSMSPPHTATSVWLLVLAVQLVLLVCGGQASDDTKRCKLFSESPAERKVLSLLEPLTNKTFSVGTTSGKDNYTYQFQVCGDAGKTVGAGLVQTGKKSETVLGLYTATQAIGGSDWVMLIYSNGTKYDTHCSKEMRKAIVMISCNRGVEMGKLEVVLEERERERDCFYLFELDSSAVCPALPSQLSAGSIILIIGFVLLSVYLICGFLYQRLIVGAKGLQQFPNYVFWTQVGNLAADGCNFVCRTQGPEEEPPTYRGVSTEPEEQPEERDDHLLPM